MVRHRSSEGILQNGREQQKAADPPAYLSHQKILMDQEKEFDKKFRNRGKSPLEILNMFMKTAPSSYSKKHSLGIRMAALIVISWFVLHLYNNSRTTKYKDGPPSNLFVTGRRSYYTPVLPEFRKTAWIGMKSDSHLERAFRSQGWTTSSKERDFHSGKFHILYNRRNEGGAKTYSLGEPWQRYSRIPSTSAWESKDGFLEGFRTMQQQYEHESLSQQDGTTTIKDLMYMVPETYRLKLREDRNKFTQIINQDKALGRHRPWVLKKVKMNNGKGIEMIPPDSPALYSAVERSRKDDENDYVVQSYICNELTWFDGQKFDLRFYWLVASVDPLIVLYHDGYARVAGSQYNESDWSTTDQHLTNHKFRTTMGEEDVLADAFWRRIRQYYSKNKSRLSEILPAAANGDPVLHVRNQIKESISTLALAFKNSLQYKDFTKAKVTTENLFALYGADFIIDQDLDVYFIEAQAAPGMGDGYDYRVELFRSLFRPMINIVEEIALKQQTSPNANLLPLKSLGDYDVVYAASELTESGKKSVGSVGGTRGGSSQDDSNSKPTYFWRYEYEGYERSKNKKGCELSTT